MAFGVLCMKPINFVDDEEIDQWGNDKFEILLNYYGSTQKHSWQEGVGRKAPWTHKDAPPIIDAEAARTEWTYLKKTVKACSYSKQTTATLYQQVFEDENVREKVPNILKLAGLAVTLPIHTADVERSFSVQNMICTPLRNTISISHQDNLMRVFLEGPKEARSSEEYSRWIDMVVEKWSSTRSRMLLKRKQTFDSE